MPTIGISAVSSQFMVPRTSLQASLCLLLRVIKLHHNKKIVLCFNSFRSCFVFVVAAIFVNCLLGNVQSDILCLAVLPVSIKPSAAAFFCTPRPVVKHAADLIKHQNFVNISPVTFGSAARTLSMYPILSNSDCFLPLCLTVFSLARKF